MADHRQVVGDEEIGEAEVALEVLQEVDDLGPDRDVQGGDRLVGDDELRLQGQRPGDADPLALAAAEGVGIAAAGVGRQADERAGGPTRPRIRGALADTVDDQRLGDDVGTRIRGLRLA